VTRGIAHVVDDDQPFRQVGRPRLEVAPGHLIPGRHVLPGHLRRARLDPAPVLGGVAAAHLNQPQFRRGPLRERDPPVPRDRDPVHRVGYHVPPRDQLIGRDPVRDLVPHRVVAEGTERRHHRRLDAVDPQVGRADRVGHPPREHGLPRAGQPGEHH